MLAVKSFYSTPFYSGIDLSCKICLHMNNNNKGRVDIICVLKDNTTHIRL